MSKEICRCGCLMVWTKHGFLCLHCDDLAKCRTKHKQKVR